MRADAERGRSRGVGSRPRRAARLLRRIGCASASGACLAALSLAVAAALPGCAVGYVTRQSLTHLRVLAAREPVAEAIAAGRVKAEWVPKLDVIRDAKRFGADVLGLPTADLYETISVVHPEPTWVVTASPKDRLAPVTWWFPIVGRVAYRGYYRRDQAEAFAAHLRDRGLDVLLSPVPAFSTLGWFADPIRPSMLDGDEEDLANLVLHEATHALVYLRGQTDFNESLASFAGDEGALLYLERRHGAGCEVCARTRARNADSEAFGAFIEEVARRLEALYAEPVAAGEKIRRREEVFAWARDEFVRRPWRSGLYAGFPRRGLDNAVILSLRRYGSDQSAFRELLGRCAGDLRRALGAVAALRWEDLPRRRRRETTPFALLGERLRADPGCPAP